MQVRVWSIWGGVLLPVAVARLLGPRPRAEVLTGEIYPHGYLTAHPELCPLSPPLRLLILVSSAPAHAPARNAIRLTWGHYAKRSDVTIAFVLGVPPRALRPRLVSENSLYGDLIFSSFVDTYSNLTLKTLSMLEWIVTYCPQVPHILKTDDDVFVNVPRLLDFASSQINATFTIWGHLCRYFPAIRDPRSKYYLPFEQYSRGILPDYITGSAYLMTRDLVPVLLAAALQKPYMRLEDVFLTGLLAQMLNLTRKHEPRFYKDSAHPCRVQDALTIHEVSNELFLLYKQLFKAGCQVSQFKSPKEELDNTGEIPS